MGLLDDAIREHLELKRRRGADPGEVARAEQEALAVPVRSRGAGTAGFAADRDEDGGDASDSGEVPAAGGADGFDDGEIETDAVSAPSAGDAAGAEGAPPGGGGVAAGAGGPGSMQETVEIDMERVLADDGATRAQEPREPAFGAGGGDAESPVGGEQDLFEWQMPAARAEEIAADDRVEEPQVPEQIPGQERLTFE